MDKTLKEGDFDMSKSQWDPPHTHLACVKSSPHNVEKNEDNNGESYVLGEILVYVYILVKLTLLIGS